MVGGEKPLEQGKRCVLTQAQHTGVLNHDFELETLNSR